VGNLPFNIEEATMVDIFETVGPVIGFRISTDLKTGKSNGHGFCDFYDKETAAAAVLRLNEICLDGRLLRVAPSYVDVGSTAQKTRFSKAELPDHSVTQTMAKKMPLEQDELTTHPTVGSRPKGNRFLATVPLGTAIAGDEHAREAITRTVAGVTDGHLIEILAQMKAFVYTHPKEARELFQHHPQLSYAIVMGLVLAYVYPPEIFTTIASPTHSQGADAHLAGYASLHPQATLSHQTNLVAPVTASWKVAGSTNVVETTEDSSIYRHSWTTDMLYGETVAQPPFYPVSGIGSTDSAHMMRAWFHIRPL
ncbi:hypothetical protein B0H16DRAFT_1329785, partial [Mycena metata]